MTARALVHAQRRGACPGLSAPMPTGDGLLVRLMPLGTIPLAAVAELCRAARAHGNGVIEITARGSIQIRGLTALTAPRFAADIAALGIAAADGIPILSNILAGLDPEEILDAAALAADLRGALARRSLGARVGAKVSVVIDGGALSLDDVSADVRLCAEAISGRAAWRVSVGGDAASAAQLGLVAPEHGVECAVRLLEVVSRQGRDVRARDIPTGIFRSAVGDLLVAGVPRHQTRRSRDAIGMHRLRDGSLAGGIGVAFGHTDAAALERLIELAGHAGAVGIRAAAGRALMIIGLTDETASAFAAAAERLGFIVRSDDPRRHVVACAGAPICAAALIASRAIGPAIAAAAAPLIDGSFTIHVSGCTKGCAHPAAAALTIVGMASGCALVADGTARGTPFAAVAAGELPAAIAKAIASRSGKTKREASHG
jgi:precorrin-3B synthase